MSKYLIVNADDFGLCNSANEAVFDLFESGNLKSSTIMMPCPGAKDAVEFSKAHPEYAIGVHLTMTAEWKNYRWGTLSESPSLLDPDGYMWHESDQVQHHAKKEDLEREVRAQIDRALAMGMKPSHIDNHMGSLYGHQTGRLSLIPMTLRIVGEYGYAYRLYTKTDKRLLPAGVPWKIYEPTGRLNERWTKKYGVIVPDYLLFPDWGPILHLMRGDFDYELYKKVILRIWADIPEGVTETFVHPAIASDELRGITNLWFCRDAEYRLMKDPETWEFLASKGVEMISYRDLVEMRKF
ncbi:MAG: polysaccharide deacetylase family protein [Clostridia bacterium]|nr:polysaccharide deacetylase family protein [Clostridia bacterium]